MKLVLFDLGDTLEHHDVLLPGAAEMLTAVAGLRDGHGQPLGMGLVSDFDMPHVPADIPAIRQRYVTILEGLGIRTFFNPVARGVTLSTDVGVFKPDSRIFRAALDKFDPTLSFGDALFLTESQAHVQAARTLGLSAVHFKGPGQTTGQIATLLDFVPLVRAFVRPSHG